MSLTSCVAAGQQYSTLTPLLEKDPMIVPVQRNMEWKSRGSSVGMFRRVGGWRHAGGVLLLAIALCAICGTAGLAATYCVDDLNGLDSNTGIYDSQLGSGECWQTIGRVNSANLAAGDQVLFRRGGVWHQALIVPSSGTAGSPIVFGAYATGDLPLIDAMARVSNWTALGGNLYSASWPSDPGVLLYKGKPVPEITTLRFDSPVPATLAAGAILLQLGPYTNLWVTSRTQYTVSGISRYRDRIDPGVDVWVRQLATSGREQQWASSLGKPTITATTDGLTAPGHWYWDGGTLYLFSDVDPNGIPVEASTFATGINTNGKNDLVIRDLKVRGAGGVGILLNNSERVTVSGAEVFGSGLLGHQTGILLLSSSSSRVENCRVDTVLGGGLTIYAWGNPARDNVISGNTFDRPGAGGISLSTDGGGQSSPSLVTGNLIENNTIQDANQLVYDSAGIYTLFSGTGNVIRGNAIRDGGSVRLRSAGIMVDQGSGAMTIENNLVVGNSNGGIDVSSAGHVITGNRLFYNGVASWLTAQVVFFPVNAAHTAANCTVTSNTIQAGPGQNLFYVQPGATTGHNIDYNVYHDGAALPFLWNVWNNAGTDFAGWQQVSGQDSHSSYSRTSPPRPPADFRVITGVYHLLL